MEVAGLRWLALDRPEAANALDAVIVAELDAAWTDAEHDGVGVVAIRGEGPHLCGGVDLEGSATPAALLDRFTRIAALLERLRSATGPVPIGVAHGAAFGAGADLMLACHLRVATDDARFRFPGPRFGLVLGTERLAAIIGPDLARAILLEQREIDGEAALSLGMVHHLVEDEPHAWARVRELARQVLDLEPDTIRRLLDATMDPVSGPSALGRTTDSLLQPELAVRFAAFRDARG